MAKLDFPGAPISGTKYPQPPVAGQPVYTWDGEKWVGAALAIVPSNAPFDAMAYSGMQINGGMEVSQELAGGNLTNVAGHVCDGWKLGFEGSMGFISNAISGPGLFYTPYRLLISTTTAQGSLGATNHLHIFQRIEGWRVLRLGWGTANAQPITICFWSAHFRAGVYSVAIRNGPSNRCYVTTYTQSVSNVAQYNTITVPGDTTGTWNIDNTTGLEIGFCLAAGTTYTAPTANIWAAGFYLAAPGQVNAVSATSDVFRITGVTVLPGTQAPTAAQSPNIMRPYDQELVTCRRYYWQGTAMQLRGAVVSGQGPAALAMTPLASFRAIPTLSVSGGITIIDGNVGNGTFSTIAASTSSHDTIVFTPGALTGAGFGVANVPVMVSMTSSGILKADARL